MIWFDLLEKKAYKAKCVGEKEAAMLILLAICQGRGRALQLDDLQQEWRLIKESFLSLLYQQQNPHSYVSPSGQLT